MNRSAIILFAHGSRDPLWHRPIEAVARQIAAQAPDVPVCCAYLESSTPDLMQAVSTLVAAQVTQIRVLPLFLGVGRHAREDLPLLLQAVQTQHPQIAFEWLDAIGEHPQMTQLMAQIALQGLS